jgi:Tfp pilus assembly protein PilN
MIKRINFIEKKALSFTYLKLLQICLAIILFNALLVAFQYVNAYRLQASLKVAQTSLGKLEATRDELIKKPAKKKVSVGEYQDLLDKLESAPSWSKLLEDISRRLPSSVWITDLKSAISGGPTSDLPSLNPKSYRKGKKEKEKESEEEAKTIVAASKAIYKLEMSGTSKDARTVSEFLSKLSNSDFIKNLTLNDSKKESSGYSFKISSELKSYAH